MHRLPMAEPEPKPRPPSVWTFARSLIWGLLLVALTFWGVLIVTA